MIRNLVIPSEKGTLLEESLSKVFTPGMPSQSIVKTINALKRQKVAGTWRVLGKPVIRSLEREVKSFLTHRNKRVRDAARSFIRAKAKPLDIRRLHG